MKFKSLINWLSKPANLWGSIFVYTILTGLFVQLVFLPHIVPSWHAGYGLLKKMDGRKFHRIALELSEKIEAQGWSEWEPLPRGQFVSGVAAIFYTLIYPAPWSVLPVNAILNASACVCFYLMLTNLIGNRPKGLVASLPFIFYPSNLLWNTQFHNENYAIPGVIFILYGWTLITRRESDKTFPSREEDISVMLLIVLGSVLLGFVRVYILSGITYLFITVSAALAIYWLAWKLRVPEYLAKLFLAISVCAIMLFVVSAIESLDSDLPTNTGEARSNSSGKWEETSWLPTDIDNQFRELAKNRKQFVRTWAHGGSSIDLNVTFRNASDMIAYVPRSIQIGFLAPFPDMWFSKSKKDSGTAMRIISGFEMTFAYSCLLGLPLFVWGKRRQPVAWVAAFVCTVMLVIYAMIIPNIGSLYRFRYPYFMPLVCFGLAGWLEYGSSVIFKLKSKPLP